MAKHGRGQSFFFFLFLLFLLRIPIVYALSASPLHRPRKEDVTRLFDGLEEKSDDQRSQIIDDVVDTLGAGERGGNSV